jgi:hypothetical protein
MSVEFGAKVIQRIPDSLFQLLNFDFPPINTAHPTKVERAGLGLSFAGNTQVVCYQTILSSSASSNGITIAGCGTACW